MDVPLADLRRPFARAVVARPRRGRRAGPDRAVHVGDGGVHLAVAAARAASAWHRVDFTVGEVEYAGRDRGRARPAVLPRARHGDRHAVDRRRSQRRQPGRRLAGLLGVSGRSRSDLRRRAGSGHGERSSTATGARSTSRSSAPPDEGCSRSSRTGKTLVIDAARRHPQRQPRPSSQSVALATCLRGARRQRWRWMPHRHEPDPQRGARRTWGVGKTTVAEALLYAAGVTTRARSRRRRHQRARPGAGGDRPPLDRVARARLVRLEHRRRPDLPRQPARHARPPRLRSRRQRRAGGRRSRRDRRQRHRRGRDRHRGRLAQCVELGLPRTVLRHPRGQAPRRLRRRRRAAAARRSVTASRRSSCRSARPRRSTGWPTC